jgi:hypothetical protein
MPYEANRFQSLRPRIDEAIAYTEAVDLAEVGWIELPRRILSAAIPARALSVLIQLFAQPDHKYTEAVDAYGRVRLFETHFAGLTRIGRARVEGALRWLVDSEFVLEQRAGPKACRYRVNPDLLAGFKQCEMPCEGLDFDQAA